MPHYFTKYVRKEVARGQNNGTLKNIRAKIYTEKNTLICNNGVFITVIKKFGIS